MDYYLKPPEPKVIYNRLKQSARKRNIEFSLTVHDIWLLDIPLTCPIIGIPMKWHRGSPQDDSFSFDRIDSSKGYSIDNIQIISFRANRAKNNLTAEELKKFSQYFG